MPPRAPSCWDPEPPKKMDIASYSDTDDRRFSFGDYRARVTSRLPEPSASTLASDSGRPSSIATAGSVGHATFI